jgi:predicted transcriptional regulator
MAKVPTKDEVIRAILDELAALKVRVGEIAKLLPIQLKLDAQGIRAAEFNDALKSMVDDGLIEAGPAGYIKLTDKGFEKV